MVTDLALGRIQAALSEVRAARSPVGDATRAETARGSPAAIRAFVVNGPERIPALEPHALASAVENLTKNVQNLQRSLQFSVDEASGRTIIKVIDKETDQLIRQIPSAEVLAIAQRIEDAVGLLLEDEA